MKIEIRHPLGYSQIGRKDQQEDAVWPLFEDVTEKDRVLVLCDGVGGSEHGEVASKTVSQVIGKCLSEALATKENLTDADVVTAVENAYDALDAVDTHDGQVSMATTLTCVAIHSDGILAAHMGDSRIYHIRPRVGVLYQSADHSLVNALLMAGELTPEEAKTFPRKNVITKALQPNSKRMRAEVHQLTDIKVGDYIFLCCDGVLEQLTNQKLVEILSMNISDEEKIKLLESESTDRTKDNYTAYLMPIDKVEGTSRFEQADDAVNVVIEDVDAQDSNVEMEDGSGKSIVSKVKVPKFSVKVLYFLLCVLFFAVLSFLISSYFLGDDKKEDNTIEEAQKSREIQDYPINNIKIKSFPEKSARHAARPDSL